MREAWTDERLDDLNEWVSELGRRMDSGFNQVRDEIRSLDLKIDSKLGSLDSKIDSKLGSLDSKSDSRTDSLRAEMKGEFLAVRSELASLHRLMVQLTGGVIVTIVATQIASRL